MLNSIKNDLQDLLAANKLEEVFRRLRNEVLNRRASCYNVVILLEARWKKLEEEDAQGTLDFKEKDLNFNKITQSLIGLVENISIADLAENLRALQKEHQAIPEKHRFACDRYEQSEDFQLYLLELNEQLTQSNKNKLHFCYFYGDSRQQLDALFERFELEANDSLYNWRNESFESASKVTAVKIKPRVVRHPRLFLINILKEIFGRFCFQMYNQQPLAERKLSHLANSESLKTLGPQDYVFILLTLDDHNWNKKLVLETIQNLYSNFCNCELREDAPQFFFFFGIEYQKNRTDIQEEVRSSFPNVDYGIVLPELQPVKKADVSEWLSVYREIVPNGMDAFQMAEALFPEQQIMDMADVLPKLKEIIDLHNKRLIIKLE